MTARGAAAVLIATNVLAVVAVEMAAGEFAPGKYRLRIKSLTAQGQTPSACFINVDEETTVAAGNRFSVRYLGDIRAGVAGGGEVFLEFSSRRLTAEATFTLKGASGPRGYQGALASTSFYCSGTGTWSMERLDLAAVREPAGVLAAASPAKPQAPAAQGASESRAQTMTKPPPAAADAVQAGAGQHAPVVSPDVKPAATGNATPVPVAPPPPDAATLERLRVFEQRLAIANQSAVAPAAPLSAQPGKAVAARRVHALVIGNSRYRAAPLPNAVNDARAIAARLRSFGFDVETVLDADRAKLVGALANYGNKVTDADVAILYYAGYGVQINGINYLLPTDLDLTGPATSIALQGIPLSMILENYLPGRARLVFLDACRENPLSRSLAGRGIGRGLAPMDVATGTLISYATKDGSLAEDGGGPNSPYTTALLEFLSEPEDISLVLRKVRQKVMSATQGRQQPWEYGSLVGDKLVLSQIAK